MTTDRCEEGGQRRRRQYYVLEGTVPVPLPNLDVKTMRSWSETAYRCVARTDLTPEVEVTTVFLGVDQGPTLDGPPLLFATGVDGGPLDGEDGFYSTWPEAEQGHEAMCTRVRATLAIAGLPPCPPGSLCEVCLDAPAVGLQPAPWGGERGVCAACAARTRPEEHGGEASPH